MNYLNFINTFSEYKSNEKLSTIESSVFHYILEKANRNFWKKDFPLATKSACNDLCISKNTFLKARDKLKQRNLISFLRKYNSDIPIYNLIEIPLWKINNQNAKYYFNRNFNSTNFDFNQNQKNESQTKKPVFKNNYQSLKKSKNTDLKNINELVHFLNELVHFLNPYINMYKNKKTSSKEEAKKEKFEKFESLSRSLNKISRDLRNSPLNNKPREQKTKNIDDGAAFSGVLRREKQSSDINVSNGNKSGLKPLKIRFEISPLIQKQIKNFFSRKNCGFLAQDFIEYYSREKSKTNKNWRKIAKNWIRSEKRLQQKKLNQNFNINHQKQIVGGEFSAECVGFPQVGNTQFPKNTVECVGFPQVSNEQLPKNTVECVEFPQVSNEQLPKNTVECVEFPQVSNEQLPKNIEPENNVENQEKVEDYLKKYDYLQVFKEKLLSGTYQSWLEILGMQLKIPVRAFESAIDDFIISVKFEDNKVHSDFNDFKNHFKNWVRLKINLKRRLEEQKKTGRL